MNKSEYTKGNWVFGDWISGRHGSTNGSEWVEVWSEYGGDKGLPFVACKHHDEVANARLISAAPDQHEALIATQALLERLGLESSDEYSLNAAAIAKALGK